MNRSLILVFLFIACSASSQIRDSILDSLPPVLGKVAEDSLMQQIKKGRAIPYFINSAPVPGFSYLENDNIEYDGTFSRGLMLGSQQNTSLTSDLNLSLYGFIGDGIRVEATLNDQNIPFQPEGNTSNVREFDQMFITFSRKKEQLQFGDVRLLSNRSSAFLNYRRKGQGVKYQNNTISDTLGSRHHYSYMLSNGKYARQFITGIEGSQGPYKLRGANNEAFIIVLSGSERVYIDGVLLKRGQEHDYTIDYNLGEITFTAKQLITKDKRIQVEFEYMEQNYLRSIVQASNEFVDGRWKFGGEVFIEGDHKNQPVLSSYGSDEIESLALAGDNLENAKIASAQSGAFNIERIQYTITDTFYLDNNSGDTIKVDSVFKHITTNGEQIYNAQFAFVGQGEGDYVAVSELANGKVFEWVAPIQGVKQGSYDPIIQLIPPSKKEFYSAHLHYDINKNLGLRIELAHSINDLNTFSNRDVNDDKGYAMHLKTTGNGDTVKILNQEFLFQPKMDYKWIGDNFSTIENFLPMEFYRNWNIISLDTSMTIATGGLSLRNGKKKFSLTGMSVIVPGQSFGYRQGYQVSNAGQRLQYDWRGTYLIQEGSGSNFFNKPLFDFQYRALKKLLFFGKYMEEHNEQQIADGLSSASFRFWERTFGLKSQDSTASIWKIFYKERKDFLSDSIQLRLATHAHDFNFENSLRLPGGQVLSTILKYRRMDVESLSLTPNLEDEETVLGRLEYRGAILNKIIKQNLFYEVGSGLERRREYRFVSVANNDGQYTWTDFNGDGLQDLNEFQLDNRQYAIGNFKNYIRVFTLSNQLQKTRNIQGSYRLFVDPKKAFAKQSKGYKVARVLQLQGNWRGEQKYLPQGVSNELNPFADILDTLLITKSLSRRMQAFLWRNSSLWNMVVSSIGTSSRQFLSTGFDDRSMDRLKLETRLRWWKKSTLTTETTIGHRTAISENFPENNFDFTLQDYKPGVTFQLDRVFSLRSNYRYALKEDTSGVNAAFKEVSAELKYSKPKAGIFNVKLSYITLDFNGSTSSNLGYALLEGLQPGRNIVWQLTFNKIVKKSIQVNLSYNGRRTLEATTVHNGNVSLRYLF